MHHQTWFRTLNKSNESGKDERQKLQTLLFLFQPTHKVPQETNYMMEF